MMGEKWIKQVLTHGRAAVLLFHGSNTRMELQKLPAPLFATLRVPNEKLWKKYIANQRLERQKNP